MLWQIDQLQSTKMRVYINNKTLTLNSGHLKSQFIFI